MDMTNKAGAAGFDYKADDGLWKAIPDFRFRTLPLSVALRAILPDLALLALWCAGLLLLMRRAARRMSAEAA